MNTVVIIWAVVAGIALTLGGVHGILWLLDRRARANLAFFVLAISVAAIAITELGMMNSATPAEYGRWVRWFHVPNFLLIAGIVFFVHLQFGTGRVWLGATIVAIRAIQLGLNFVLEPNVNWSEISSLRTITFLGEPVSVVGRAVAQGIQPIATLANVLLFIYVADALRQALRRDDRELRRKAIIICGGLLAYVLVSSGAGQLIIWGIVQMPVVISPPFLILMLAITYELSRDIVASTRGLREAQRLRDELAHTARVHTISQLSASLAHELNQPLTSILFNARAAQKMIESGQPDMNEFGAILEASLPDNLPAVRADRVQLSQVLLNLIINGFDSISGSSRPGRRVRVAARSGQDEIEVAVTDSGSGIDAALLPRLFEAFVTTKANGLGLGLSVARDIVERHGGRLWAENNADGGATFRFTLPLAAG